MVDDWSTLTNKARKCKRAFTTAWHTKTFKNDVVEISKLKYKLQSLLNMGDSSSHVEEIKSIRHQIDCLQKQEEFYWGQRSKVKWLTWGDKNTSFFHASIVQRRDRNRLHGLKDIWDLVGRATEHNEGHQGVLFKI